MNNHKMKRFTAGLLAVLLSMGCPAASVVSHAAGGYGIVFSPAGTEYTTIIEGDKVNANAVLPLNHYFNPTKPFLVKKGGVEVTGAPPFLISKNSDTSYTVTANAGAADGNQATYTLEPALNANLILGSGTLNVPPDPKITDDPGVYTTTDITYTGSNPGKLPIDVNSSFSFKTTSDESPDGLLTFGSIEPGATGHFIGLTEKPAIDGVMTLVGGRRLLKIKLGDYAFDISFSMPASAKILKGSTFVINYKLQGINPLQLTVATPQWAVNDIAKSISDNAFLPGIPSVPNNPPSIPDGSKVAYINLAKGDSPSTITTNFEVLSQVARYNTASPNMPHITWKWVADDPACSNVVDFGDDGRPTQAVTLNPRKEDVKGKLTAVVDYKKGGTTVVSTVPVNLDITILGTGTPPKVEALTQTVGTKAAEAITRLPLIMDSYTGQVPGFTPPTYPHTATATMRFGAGRGRAEKAIIWAASAIGGEADALQVFVDNSPVPHPLDGKTDIINTDKVAGSKALTIVAKKQGSILLHFDYYVRDNRNQLVKSVDSETYRIEIKDTTPSSFAQLGSLQLQSPELLVPPAPEAASVLYPGGVISYGFKSSTFQYVNIELPHTVEKLNITPSVQANRGINETIHYEITTTGGVPIIGDVKTGDTIRDVPMFVESPRVITLTLKAQDGTPQLYILTVNRMPPDQDSTLKDLTVTNIDGGAILGGFSPTQKEYAVSVPYKTRWARFEASTTSVWSTYAYNPLLTKGPDGTFDTNWRKLSYPGDGIFGGLVPTTKQEVKVQAQAPGSLYSTTYTVRITRQDPSKNNLVGAVAIKDNKDREMAFDGGAKFDKNTKIYYLHIPYSATQLQLSLTPDDKVAQSIALTAPDGKPAVTLPYPGDGVGLRFNVDTPVGGNTEKTFEIAFTAKAENDTITDPPYILKVTRNDPEEDDTLTSLELRDQNDGVVPTFSFNPQTPTYAVTVPFDTELVRVIPKPRSLLATAKVNGMEITPRQPSVTVKLKPGESKEVKVQIFPEDIKAAPREYLLTVTRQQASTDARLKSLVVGGAPLTPGFIPGTTLYSVAIPEGTNGITFTAVPLHPGSTMTLNGMDLKAGAASALYEPPDAKSKVTIEVTAQDGKAKLTYIITVTNQNLLPKGKNAELYSLEVNFGSISPRFKPNITEYEVAVKDEVTSVDIIPEADDPNATLKVSSESKELGDYYGEYSAAIRDGENLFTVEVTAEDGKTKKDYEITVYRKDEEKQGTYKPIIPEMVDYTTNPIVVDISRYTVVSADVFNTLKTKYPEKTMIFQGNDYSLQITGKDIAQLIPHATIYDLGLTFSSPNEEAIWDLLVGLDSRNSDVEPVFIHFNHHGALPAPMLFTISLGRSYRTQNATWNYYNEERQRIDFYGGVRTNSRGTFTVPVTHFSTYIYTKNRIIGAENKSGELSTPGSITGGSGVGKPNPNTGIATGRAEQ